MLRSFLSLTSKFNNISDNEGDFDNHDASDNENSTDSVSDNEGDFDNHGDDGYIDIKVLE